MWVVCGLLLVVGAVAWRGGPLLGPVFFYELLRAARRRRTYFFRTLYATILLVLVCYVYLLWRNRFHWRNIDARLMAEFAASFFYSFAAVQFALVVLLTPATTASAIAEEKERKTLEFLLATDLNNREIVLSKLAARLANLVLLVLAGLPILSCLQFLGGVDPNLLLAAFAATGLTMLSLGSWGILNSVLARKPRDAIVRAYLGFAVYLILSGLSWLLLIPRYGLASFPSHDGWDSPVTLQDVVEWLNAGNFVSALSRLANHVGRGGGSLDDVLWERLGEYALFHGLVALACTTWAVGRLRTVALKETYQQPRRPGFFRRRPRRRPAIGNRPMLWKEVVIEPGFRLTRIGRLILGLLVLLSFVPAATMIHRFIDIYVNPQNWGWMSRYYSPWEYLGRQINEWVRSLGTIVATLMLLAVAIRAASTISGERDRQTLDTLLITPLDSDTILFAKGLGSILSVRWLWLWLGAIGLVGLATGGLHPLAVPLLVLAWFVYAVVFTLVGLCCSMLGRSSLHATLWTVFLTVGISVGHWVLMGLCCFGPLSLMNVREHEWEWLVLAEIGQTPPAVLGCLAFYDRDLENLMRSSPSNEAFRFGVSCLFGIASWALLALALWRWSSQRFRALAGLKPHPRSPLLLGTTSRSSP